jgi:hypothetical protein
MKASDVEKKRKGMSDPYLDGKRRVIRDLREKIKRLHVVVSGREVREWLDELDPDKKPDGADE